MALQDLLLQLGSKAIPAVKDLLVNTGKKQVTTKTAPVSSQSGLSDEKRTKADEILKAKGLSVEKKSKAEEILKAKGLTLPGQQATNIPTPQPLSEVLKQSSAFTAAQEKSKKEGKFNTHEERRAYMPIQDVLSEDFGTPLQSLIGGAGTLIEGAGKNIEDVSKGQMPRIVKETGDVLNAGTKEVQKTFADTIANPANLIKAPVELATGAVKAVPKIAGNLINTGLDVIGQGSKILNIPQEAKDLIAKGSYDLQDFIDKGADAWSDTDKKAIEAIGLNPDSVASKVGAFATELAAQIAITKKLGFGSKVLNSTEAVGSKLISDSKKTGVISGLARSLLNTASKKIPQAVNNLKDSAVLTAANSAVQKGEVPNAGDFITGMVMDKFLNIKGDKMIDKARMNYINKAAINQAKEEGEDKFISVIDRMMDKGLAATSSEGFKDLMSSEYAESNKLFKAFLNKNNKPVNYDLGEFLATKFKDNTKFGESDIQGIKKILQVDLAGRKIENLKDINDLVAFANTKLKPYLSQQAVAVGPNSGFDKQAWELVRNWGKQKLQQELPKNIYEQRFRAEISKRALDAYEEVQKALNNQNASQILNVNVGSKEAKKTLKNLLDRKKDFGAGTISAVLGKKTGELLKSGGTKSGLRNLITP